MDDVSRPSAAPDPVLTHDPKQTTDKKRIAILGGGPSGLFIYKRLIESGRSDFIIDIFEAGSSLGAGMPYSSAGANVEHITNVSGNEIPDLVFPVTRWIKSLPEMILDPFDLDAAHFSDYKVFPRLLFGKYLHEQFQQFVAKGNDAGITTCIRLNTRVTDIIDQPVNHSIVVETENKDSFTFDHVVISTGHVWPKTYESVIDGYFDSPYPPAKLARQTNHTVAIRGASLTAIDAIRTIARQHGAFMRDKSGKVTYHPSANAQHFRIVMHSRHGLLPGVRFHLADPHLGKSSLLSDADIARHRKENDGFLSLDYIFEKDFKQAFQEKDPVFFALIRDMPLEEFVDAMMDMRERVDAFLLLKAEYQEAAESIEQKKTVYWKELLAILSFAMNYPAKHFSAEDMQRLQGVLMPLISIVIAFVPQSSCEEMIALHEAGRLEIISVGRNSYIEPDPAGGILYHLEDASGEKKQIRYKTFIDCVGQPHLSIADFPFKSLVLNGTVSQATLPFRSAEAAKSQLADINVEPGGDGSYYLKVPGLKITDHFETIDQSDHVHPNLFIMAVPFIGGYNPDYSGLDFCEKASQLIVERILNPEPA